MKTNNYLHICISPHLDVFRCCRLQCVYLSANRFSMAWERGIQVPYPFFVFAWHWKTDLNFAFCFSFSPNFQKRFWTSYFVFRFRITLKNGLQFRFSFCHHYEKQIWISFVILAWLEKRITAPVQSFEAPATPSGLTGACTFYVTESKWIFPSPGPKWVVNSAPPSPNDMSYTHTVFPFLTMDDKWYDDSREKTRSRNTCISSMEKESDKRLSTLQLEVTKCEATKNYKSSFTASGVFVEWLNNYKVPFLSSFPGYNKLLHYRVFIKQLGHLNGEK